jgi:ADP-ribosyl-[dinitrogen reductase] hydrolase
MKAGENTLDTIIARLLSKSLVSEGKFDLDHYLGTYTKFMTTPGSHNDTYAATAHRMFFANFVKGRDVKSCADNDGKPKLIFS